VEVLPFHVGSADPRLLRVAVDGLLLGAYYPGRGVAVRIAREELAEEERAKGKGKRASPA
jgi:hypothetical protein